VDGDARGVTSNDVSHGDLRPVRENGTRLPRRRSKPAARPPWRYPRIRRATPMSLVEVLDRQHVRQRDRFPGAWTNLLRRRPHRSPPGPVARELPAANDEKRRGDETGGRRCHDDDSLHGAVPVCETTVRVHERGADTERGATGGKKQKTRFGPCEGDVHEKPSPRHETCGTQRSSREGHAYAV
jgi:hypothetical protein